MSNDRMTNARIAAPGSRPTLRFVEDLKQKPMFLPQVLLEIIGNLSKRTSCSSKILGFLSKGTRFAEGDNVLGGVSPLGFYFSASAHIEPHAVSARTVGLMECITEHPSPYHKLAAKSLPIFGRARDFLKNEDVAEFADVAKEW